MYNLHFYFISKHRGIVLKNSQNHQQTEYAGQFFRWQSKEMYSTSRSDRPASLTNQRIADKKPKVKPVVVYN